MNIELPKLKEPELTNAEEKLAWSHYSAGYLNAQQDMIRAGWKSLKQVEVIKLAERQNTFGIANTETKRMVEQAREELIKETEKLFADIHGNGAMWTLYQKEWQALKVKKC